MNSKPLTGDFRSELRLPFFPLLVKFLRDSQSSLEEEKTALTYRGQVSL